MGRAARNVNGRVLLFANKITPSMQKAMEVTDYRRSKQEAYNKAHNITPQSVSRKLDEDLKNQDLGILYEKAKKSKDKMPKSERDKLVKELSRQMHEAAKKLEFEEAARLRDEIAKLRAM